MSGSEAPRTAEPSARGGLPRLHRRAVVGAAVWTAPAIVLATAVPARAASITPEMGGVTIASLYGSWYSVWSQDSMANVPAVVCGGSFQNHDYAPDFEVSPIVTLTVTFIIPLAGWAVVEGEPPPVPRVGIGVYEQGPTVAALTVGTPSYNADYTACTVTATYVGGIDPGSSVQFYNVWVESPNRPTGSFTASANAVHQTGDTSSANSAATVQLATDPNLPAVPFPTVWPPA